MESVEYLREQTSKLRTALDQVHVLVNRVNSIPRRQLKDDLLRGAAPGTTAEDINKMLGVIDWSREGAQQKLSQMLGDVESLHAAVDDAIGVAGRLV